MVELYDTTLRYGNQGGRGCLFRRGQAANHQGTRLPQHTLH